MIFKFIIDGLVKAKNKEEACNKLKDEFGTDFFSKHISVTEEVEDKNQKGDIE